MPIGIRCGQLLVCNRPAIIFSVVPDCSRSIRCLNVGITALAVTAPTLAATAIIIVVAIIVVVIIVVVAATHLG